MASELEQIENAAQREIDLLNNRISELQNELSEKDRDIETLEEKLFDLRDAVESANYDLLKAVKNSA